MRAVETSSFICDELPDGDIDRKGAADSLDFIRLISIVNTDRKLLLIMPAPDFGWCTVADLFITQEIVTWPVHDPTWLHSAAVTGPDHHFSQ